DKKVVLDIGDDYTNEMRFQLPLPDNRRELVELLDLEVAAGFESNKGAMERLGVENVQAKLQEIESERNKRRFNSAVSYGNEDVDEEGGEELENGEYTAQQQRTLCRTWRTRTRTREIGV